MFGAPDRSLGEGLTFEVHSEGALFVCVQFVDAAFLLAVNEGGARSMKTPAALEADRWTVPLRILVIPKAPVGESSSIKTLLAPIPATAAAAPVRSHALVGDLFGRILAQAKTM